MACAAALWAVAACGQDAASFRALCAEQAAAAEAVGATVVEGLDGWLFLPAELRHIGAGRFWGAEAAGVTRATDPASADPLPAIVDFQQQLAQAGVELIFVPVPPKAVIYPEGVSPNPPAGRADEFHREFYEQLRGAGVNVLDLTDDFLAAKAAGPALYCRQDTHWSGQACIVAARKLAAAIFERPWAADLPRRDWTPETRDVEITGDLWSSLNRPALPKEKLPLRFVRDAAGAPPADDRASPIVFLGDSHNLIFHAGDDMQAAGAGLADQLALELGTAVDVLGVRGSGATPSRINFYRRIKADPAYLAGKKAVIWCLSAREFTESTGWKKVPVLP